MRPHQPPPTPHMKGYNRRQRETRPLQSPRRRRKSYPKSRCWSSICSICFFCLISASFLAICQIHVGFMALSWHFHGAFFLLIFIVFLNSFMALACQIHGRFIADSCQFLSVPKKQKHVRFMSLSWQFHGTFMALSHTSLTWVQCPKIYWKKLFQKSVLCEQASSGLPPRNHTPAAVFSARWFHVWLQMLSPNVPSQALWLEPTQRTRINV